MRTVTMRALLATTVAVGALLAATMPGSAAPVVWTDWSSTFSTGSPSGGSASGTMGGVTVTYSGELLNLLTGYPSYTPNSTWVGGIVGNAPGPSNSPPDQIIQLQGGGATGTDTVTFSQPVTDPIFAIWSLGAGGSPAQFVFNATPVLDAGGPSAEYSGASITISGNTVNGAEGNGSIDFPGTYSSISFTTPLPEFWYGFTVGMPVSVPPVPEPATLVLVGTGLLGLGIARLRKR